MEKTNNCCKMERNNQCDICFQMQKSGIRNACVRLFRLIKKELPSWSQTGLYNLQPTIAILNSIQNSIEVYDCIVFKKISDRVTYAIENLKGKNNVDLTSSDCLIIEMLLE